MTTRVLILALSMFLFQVGCGQSKTDIDQCNRRVYGTLNFIKSLPSYICIPEGFIIDDFVRVSDVNGDGLSDFLAIKYNKREDDQNDGDITFWRFYTRSKGDSVYTLSMTLQNIVPPYLKDISYEYLLSHPIAEKIFQDFPRRVSHSMSFRLNNDTIRLAYKLDDSYGKSFVFVNDNSTWYLREIEYFIGELPTYWWKDDDFYYPLNDKLKIIESRKPKQPLNIKDFDLRVAFKHHELEQDHLSKWHIDQISKTNTSSIEDIKFINCDGHYLPDDWAY